VVIRSKDEDLSRLERKLRQKEVKKTKDVVQRPNKTLNTGVVLHDVCMYANDACPSVSLDWPCLDVHAP